MFIYKIHILFYMLMFVYCSYCIVVYMFIVHTQTLRSLISLNYFEFQRLVHFLSLVFMYLESGPVRVF